MPLLIEMVFLVVFLYVVKNHFLLPRGCSLLLREVTCKEPVVEVRNKLVILGGKKKEFYRPQSVMAHHENALYAKLPVQP